MMASALPLRAIVIAAMLLAVALAGADNIDETNTEGSTLPELLSSLPSAGLEQYDYDQATVDASPDLQQHELFVVAVDGNPLTAAQTADTVNQQQTSASTSPGISSSDQPPQPLLSPQQGVALAAAASKDAAGATVAAAAVAANPAATAAVASFAPSLGVPPAGSRIAGRYVVIFKDNVSSVTSGTDRLHRHVSRRLARAAAAAAASSGSSGTVGVASVAVAATAAVAAVPAQPFRVRGKLGRDDDDDNDSQQRAFGVAAFSSTGSRSGSRRSTDKRLKGLVVEVPPGVQARALYRALRSSADVQKVVQDRVIAISQSQCVAANALAGMPGSAPTLQWRGCRENGTRLYWFGERCGANLSKTRWLGMYSMDTATNTMVPGCLQYRKSPDSDPWNAVNMGACGVAPTAAPKLPVSVCADTNAAGCISPAKLSMLRLTLNKPVSCNGASSSQLVLQGNRCGPGLGFVQWSSVVMPDGARCSYSRSVSDKKFNNDWLGTCGVTPNKVPLPGVVCTAAQTEAGISEFQAGNFRSAVSPSPKPSPSPSPSPSPLPSPSPSPSPSPLPSPSPSPIPVANSVPSMDLAASEFVPINMQRIEAVYRSKVPDLSRAPVPGVVVAVVDTGVDSTHPDLNVVGGMNFVTDEPNMKFSDDSHGHGTHVAGTIGAKNQGRGIVGVAPGVGIYGLRVLKADGNGLFSDLLRAYDHLVANARSLGIRVVNLSLSGSGTAGDEECNYIKQLAAQGITVVTAAGNTGVSMLNEVPAACEGALAVTAVSDTDGVGGVADSPPSWSNFLPLPDTAANVASRIIAAPGDSITSTYPLNKPGFNGYAKMSGTSMACPHVSGSVALCYASGFCNSNVATELSKVMLPSATYSQYVDSYRFSHDPLTSPLGDKYYGYMVWNRRFWGRDSGSDWFPVSLVQRTGSMASDGTLDEINRYV